MPDTDAGESCEHCPACEMRRGLAARLEFDGGFERQEVLDELLDAVEAVRSIDAANEDEEADAALDAAIALVSVVATLHRIAHHDHDEPAI